MDDARSFGQASRLPRRSVLAGSAAVGLGLSLARLAPVASTSAPVARAAPASAPIASRKRQLAFVLSHEQFTTPQLLDFAVSAQQAGFHGFWTSDHIQPWQEDQGHAMFPWITLGLLGSKTENLFFGTGVTTPTYRYDPATVAQAFASLGTL
ncbi:MAG: LLM class flavin-dependent oxidoreductase, partial [Chloroflexi bacterium]|nr:LLM class flavin-dependent oxidoreductase [Chloroflexota bacterium]